MNYKIEESSYNNICYTYDMKYIKTFSFFLIGLVIVGSLSTAKSAFAVTTEEVTQISERLESDSGALAAAAELAGADSELFDKFQTGVKYGEFASRLWQGDYWGVAVDFVKFELGEEWDELTDYATGKAFSKGAQRLLGVFTALKDLGEWTGNKALDMQFSAAVKAGWQIYKENVSQSDLQVMMDIWWNQYGNNAKLNELGDVFVWKEKFAKVYALQKQVEEKPIAPEEIAKVQKAIKKSAVISFFKIKYPSIGSNVAEELAEAIVSKNTSTIKAIAEKYKNHLATLTVAGAESEAVSSGDICEGTEDEQKDCLAELQELVEKRNKVLSNEITYAEYSRTAAGIRPGAAGVAVYAGMPKEGSARANNLINFKKSQERAIASAYEFQFGQEIREINNFLATNKDNLQGLKNDYKDIPNQGDHWDMPSYKVSVNTGFVRFFNNVYNTVFHYGSFDYEDFKSGATQENYKEYLENEPKANAADDARVTYLKVHLGRANSLIGNVTFLQSRINSLISSAESAKGVFSYGHVTIDDLKKMASEIEELKKDIQFGERPWWWSGREGAWSIESSSNAIEGMESDKKARKSSIDQLKKDYASALKTYEGEEEQRKLEKQKQAEEEKRAVAEKEAQALKEKKAEEDAVKQERARQEAEKQAAAEKARLELEQRTKAFNVPFGESQKTTPNKVTPTTDTAKPVTPQTKPTPPPAQPSAQTKSTLPSGYSGIPNENEEIAGFSFITQGKADMMVSDFFWTSDGIYTVNGALDLGSKTINDVASVPASGYKDDPYQPEIGHVYTIKTRDGKYGIIQIDRITPPHRLTENLYLYFYWRYQPDGSTSFK